jgi:dienelactone hydrolase
MATKPIAFAAGLGALVVLCGIAALRTAPVGAAVPAPGDGRASSQDILIPLPGEQLRMHVTVLQPPGQGPFPLALINHGSSESSVERAEFPPPQYPVLSKWLLDRGYVVALPQRPGHGATGGPYFEDQGRCESPDYVKAGLATAASIQAAIEYLTAEPYVRKTEVLVLGQSAGGWGALALASRNPAMVRAVVNLAGGRGGHANGEPNNNCAPDRLVEAAGIFGDDARIPTLWLYAENDSYFAPGLSNAMYRRFAVTGGAGAGSRSEYHLLPPFGPEGHLLADSGEAVALWAPILTRFLAEHP